MITQISIFSTVFCRIPKIRRNETDYLLFMSLLCVWISATAQVGQQSQEPVDSIKNIGYMDSLFQELPEVMIIGERPIVKAEQGKLVYDVPRLVGNLPVDNAYDVG